MDSQFGNGVLMVVGALFIMVEIARWGAPAVLEAVDRSWLAWKEKATLREEMKLRALRVHAERLRLEAEVIDLSVLDLGKHRPAAQ